MFNQHLLNKELGTFWGIPKSTWYTVLSPMKCNFRWHSTCTWSAHTIHSFSYKLHIVPVLSTRPSTCQSSGFYSVRCELPAIMFSRFQKLTLSRKLSWTSFTIYSTCIILYIAFIGAQAGGHRIADPQLWKLCNSLGKTLMI